MHNISNESTTRHYCYSKTQSRQSEPHIAPPFTMPTRDEVAYFGAGPSGLPTPVITAGAQAFLNYENTGLGLAEISHRSPTATQILADARAALTQLLDIPSDYEILFCHGGGTGEFSAVVMNLVPVWVEKRRRVAASKYKDQERAEDYITETVKEDIAHLLKLDYLVTGSWSLKASQEAAQLLGPLGGKKLVNVATDARGESGGAFKTIPPESKWRLTDSTTNGGCSSAFVYYCDNETVDGVEFPQFPESLSYDDRIVVCDMSSNILSREVDLRKYGVIYAGAQKNIGITDTTIVIVRKDLLTDLPEPEFLHAVGVWSPPAILNWAVIAKNASLYNTMPIFSIWIAMTVLQSLLKTHGTAKVAGQENVANAKAAMLYNVLDTYPDVYQVVPHKSVRSRMNLCFRVKDEKTEKEFLGGVKERNLLGLNGHRSVGGVRISNYNSVTMENAKKLEEYLEEFARGHR